MSLASYQWDNVAAEQITDHISRRYITGDGVTIARFDLKKGGVVPRHAHPNEQISCMQSGTLEFRFDDRAVVVGPGEMMQIPGGVPHEVVVVEDAVVIDVFNPIRQDWIDGTDTYFNRARP
jgi:quercetin dioxygenase-like cupin family protein